MPEKDSVYRPIAGVIESLADLGIALGASGYAYYIAPPPNWSHPAHHIAAALFLPLCFKAIIDWGLASIGEAGMVGSTIYYTGKIIKELYDSARDKK